MKFTAQQIAEVLNGKVEGNMEADWSKDFLLNCGIPEQDILIESKSRNTWENSLFTSELLKENTNPIWVIDAFEDSADIEQAGPAYTSLFKWLVFCSIPNIVFLS